MKEHCDSERVIDVFIDVEAHRSAADLIRKHSTNPDDIREVALKALNLGHCKNILDIGCGFGFFTEALKDRVHDGAVVSGIDIVKGYEPLFLQACRKAGLKGRFFSSGVSLLKKIPADSYDLILCSYALYFFPGAIPDIARVLKDEGVFVAVTHDRENMGELISATKDILRAGRMLKEDRLPVEDIVSRFSAENGRELLSPWFGRVKSVDYGNSLEFGPDDIQNLVKYFYFKSPFFLSLTNFETETVAELLARHLKKSSHSKQGFILSKNDRVFICSMPIHEGKQP